MCAFLCARDLNISSSCRCCNGIVSNKTRRCFVQKKCCYVWTPPVSYCTSGCKWAWRSSFGIAVINNGQRRADSEYDCKYRDYGFFIRNGIAQSVQGDWGLPAGPFLYPDRAGNQG